MFHQVLLPEIVTPADTVAANYVTGISAFVMFLAHVLGILRLACEGFVGFLLGSGKLLKFWSSIHRTVDVRTHWKDKSELSARLPGIYRYAILIMMMIVCHVLFKFIVSSESILTSVSAAV